MPCNTSLPDNIKPGIQEISEKIKSGCNSSDRLFYMHACRGFDVIKDKDVICIHFPGNLNTYRLRYSKGAEISVAEWIYQEWEHLCWNDFTYNAPSEYIGNDPQTLDEMCVFYRHLCLRHRVTKEEKRFAVIRFLDLMFEESLHFANGINLPFRSLRLFHKGLSSIASTDCHGHIIYHTTYLCYDADSIRQTLVHELCHGAVRGHTKEFSKTMENAMLTLKLINRPCAYDEHLMAPEGARFPTGKYCPGYNFNIVDGFWNKGYKDSRFLGRVSVLKSTD